jgi:hypothetical protein
MFMATFTFYSRESKYTTWLFTVRAKKYAAQRSEKEKDTDEKERERGEKFQIICKLHNMHTQTLWKKCTHKKKNKKKKKNTHTQTKIGVTECQNIVQS